MRYDVAIIGGGPAGSAVSVLLSLLGAAVALIDRTIPDIVAPETISNDTARFLKALLGSDDNFGNAIGARSSRWGASRRVEALMVPDGLGCFIDRRWVDQALRRRAQSLGATTLRAHVWQVRQTAEEWYIDLGTGAVTASFLIDASGRACWFTRRHAGAPVVYDRLIAQSGNLEHQVLPTNEAALCAAPYGWRFLSNCAGATYCTSFTDVDLCARPAPGARSARSQRAAAVAGTRWCAIGDAAGAVDPLSSSGLSTAFRDATEASGALGEMNVSKSLRAYSDRKRSDYIDYLLKRRRYYRLEARWRRQPFWTRRQ